MPSYKVVHYINHFFAGVGGEEKADHPLEVRKGAVGPGQGLQAQLKGKADIVATIICGDNYFATNAEQSCQRIIEEVKKTGANVLVAGPAFNAGRYGFACVEVCQAVANALEIPCVMCAYRENPGVDVYQQYKNRRVICLPTTDTAAGMTEALSKLASFALRLAAGENIGFAQEEGYIPRGIRQQITVEKRGVDRAVDTLIARLQNKPFVTEIPYRAFDKVTAAPAVKNIKKAKLALVSTSGVSPYGNPDKFRQQSNTHYAKYSVEGLRTMEPGKWEAVHGGYNTTWTNANPNLGVPLDALRELEDSGEIGSLHNTFWQVPGTGTQVEVAKRMGREMAEDIKKTANPDGVILVST